MPHDRAPNLYRILLQATDLERSRRFYRTLLGVAGRMVAPGRVYFDCGPVILGLLDYSERPASERSMPTEALYLSVRDLEAVHRRAKRLRCLSQELLHGDPQSPMGGIAVRPWGERSFYVTDPAGNPLCFVETGTEFTGTPAQIAHLGSPTHGARSRRTRPPRPPAAPRRRPARVGS
jgi:catechol 2,3-dioxygenase-like lactoylglutathione lyase family enzyme